MTIKEANKELLPCPFCGSRKIKRHKAGFYNNEWVISCTRCQAKTNNYQLRKDVDTAWNSRANGWIKLSERQPEDGQEVLICSVRSWHRYFVRWNHSDMQFMPEDFWLPIPSLPPATESEVVNYFRQ